MDFPTVRAFAPVSAEQLDDERSRLRLDELARPSMRAFPDAPIVMSRDLTPAFVYDTVIHMEEVLTIRLPKGTRRRLERRAKAQKLSVSQLVRRALEQDELLTSLGSARTELLPQARAQGIYTDEDVFAIVS
jgi:predicted transcriptional regulator